MIVSFRDRDTEAFALGHRVRRFAGIETVARRKFRQLQIAARLDDLRVPPGNRLQALKGSRTGQHSISKAAEVQGRVRSGISLCVRS
jgi:proteic killer suppression protein